MKCSKAFIATIAAIAIAAWLVWIKTPHGPTPKPIMFPTPGGNVYTPPAPDTRVNPTPRHSRSIEFPWEFSDEEKQQFTNLFETKLKPAAEKWAAVYGNRVPFDLADLTPDKLVRRNGWRNSKFDSYTFVMGDITLGVEIFRGNPHVNYLASKQGIGAMNTMPQLTGAPDLSMPVTQQQVLDLVQADCGQQFPPNQIRLMPTGASGSLMGGVDAEVGKEVSNPNYGTFSLTNTDFSIVFGKDGKLVAYLRTP